MLKFLYIRNIILIDSADISFESGFNVLTGETGSGKSAVINALSLITGERADSGIIRFGADKGVVEAVFDITAIPALYPLLDEAGIEFERDDDLIIRRELNASGKGRMFINNQSAQLTLLRKLTPYLLEMVGQHANQKLFSLDSHREMLDTYGNLQGLVAAVIKGWQEEYRARNELEVLRSNASQRLREIEKGQLELEELQTARLKENEDDDLFAEYSLLTSSEELSAKASEIERLLSGDRGAILPLIGKLEQLFSCLSDLDARLLEPSKSIHNIAIELQEISHTIRNYGSRIEYNPARAAEINERLTLITRLKKRYGATIKDIQHYEADLKAKMSQLENTDVEIERLQSALLQQQTANETLCRELSDKRRAVAMELEREMAQELQELNMPKAQFYCYLEPQTRSRVGVEKIEFYLAPNVGEQKIPIKDCASGGELSRVMLALQTLLVGKAQVPTLVFDEIDANIGGETATVVGKKLNAIGKRHQILCITHFPQVASHANHHIQISKHEMENRTVTQLKVLTSGISKKQELLRMSGK